MALGDTGFTDLINSVPSLFEATTDSAADVRREAIIRLIELRARIGRGMRRYPDEAINFFQKHKGQDKRDLIPELVVSLRSEDPCMRCRAARILGAAGGMAVSAIPALVDVLQDSNELARLEAAAALGYIHSSDGAAIAPLLLSSRNDPSDKVRSAAIYSLASIGPIAGIVIPTLLEALRSNDEHVRKRAEDAFNYDNIHPDYVTAALPILVAALKDSSPIIHRHAARTLCIFSQTVKIAVSVLLEFLVDSDDEVCLAAIAAVTYLGTEAKSAVPQLVRLLHHASKRIREDAASALGFVATMADAPLVVPALVEMLNDSDEYVRYNAASALGNIGLAAKAAVPALMRALKDKSSDVRGQVASSLGKIGQEAEIVVPALLELFDTDIDDDVLIATRDALLKFNVKRRLSIPQYGDKWEDL